MDLLRKNIHQYSKISVALVGALLVSQLLFREVFLGYSPKVRPDLADSLVESTLALVNLDNYKNLFRRNGNVATDTTLTEDKVREELAGVTLQSTLIKGVYAKSSEHASLVEIRHSEVEWVKVPYTKSDGSVIMINIPAGTEPPPPGLF